MPPAVLLGLATVWLRGGFDAFRVKEHGAGGSERTVRVVFSDAGGGSTFDVLPGGDASVSPDVPDGYIVEILSGDAVYEDGSITLHGVRTPQTVVYRVRKPGVFSLRVVNDSNCGTVSPRVGLSTLAENALVRFSVTEKRVTPLRDIRSVRRSTRAARSSVPNAFTYTRRQTMRRSTLTTATPPPSAALCCGITQTAARSAAKTRC